MGFCFKSQIILIIFDERYLFLLKLFILLRGLKIVSHKDCLR